MAGGGDIILIPEIPYSVDKICESIHRREKRGRSFSIIVVAEGAKSVGGKFVTQGRYAGADKRPRLGGVSHQIAEQIEKKTGDEVRVVILGHLQRGGMPTGYDRLLATRFGAAAVRAIADEKWGHMVALQTPHIVTVPITEVLKELKRVDINHDVVQTARATGISFGD